MRIVWDPIDDSSLTNHFSLHCYQVHFISLNIVASFHVIVMWRWKWRKKKFEACWKRKKASMSYVDKKPRGMEWKEMKLLQQHVQLVTPSSSCVFAFLIGKFFFSFRWSVGLGWKASNIFEGCVMLTMMMVRRKQEEIL